MNGKWTDLEAKISLNKVIIFVFLCAQKYSCSSCHMDYFNDVLTIFLGLNAVVTLLSMEGQKALGLHQK